VPLDSNGNYTTVKSSAVVMDSLLYYIFSCEFIFILLKLVSKLIKLIMDLTSINMQKQWDYRNIVFNVISFFRYALKLLIEVVSRITYFD
jgi:hypothetical protein